MATLAEVKQWIAGIYQIETTDFVEGGATGVANLQAKQLADRTAYLKDLIENLDPEVTVADLAAAFVLPVSNGGTGANNAADARTNLGISALFTDSQSLTGNGYQILPGGLVIEWGSVTGIGDNVSGSVVFPAAFSQLFSLVWGDNMSGKPDSSGDLDVSNVGTTGFDYGGYYYSGNFWYIALGTI